MYAESAHRVVAVPNVTPMIDVMLVLLITFMVVTPTLLHGPVAEPPQAENLQSRPEIETDHTLSIDAKGALYLDKRPLAVESLQAALTPLYPAGSIDHVLYLRAHRELLYESVSGALETARLSGVAVVGLVSERKTP